MTLFRTAATSSKAADAPTCKCGTSKPHSILRQGHSLRQRGQMCFRACRVLVTSYSCMSHLQLLNSQDPKSTAKLGKVQFCPHISCSRNGYLVGDGTRRLSANETVEKVFGESKEKCNSGEMREICRREEDGGATKRMLRLLEGNIKEVV